MRAAHAAPLEGRTTLRLAAPLAAYPHTLGVSRRQLSGLPSTRLRPNPAAGIYEMTSRQECSENQLDRQLSCSWSAELVQRAQSADRLIQHPRRLAKQAVSDIALDRRKVWMIEEIEDLGP